MGREPAPQFPVAPILVHLGFEDVPFVSSGHRKVRCKFHGDRNASASVGRYSYRCFGCDRTGDAIKLIMEEEGLGFEAAIARCSSIVDGESGSLPRKSGWGDSLLG